MNEVNKIRRTKTQKTVDQALAIPASEEERVALIDQALNKRLAILLLEVEKITLSNVKEIKEILAVLRSLKGNGGGCIVLHWDETMNMN